METLIDREKRNSPHCDRTRAFIKLWASENRLQADDNLIKTIFSLPNLLKSWLFCVFDMRSQVIHNANFMIWINDMNFHVWSCEAYGISTLSIWHSRMSDRTSYNLKFSCSTERSLASPLIKWQRTLRGLKSRCGALHRIARLNVKNLHWRYKHYNKVHWILSSWSLKGMFRGW